MKKINEMTVNELLNAIEKEKVKIENINLRIEEKINNGDHRGADLLEFGIDESSDTINEIASLLIEKGYNYQFEDDED